MVINNFFLFFNLVEIFFFYSFYLLINFRVRFVYFGNKKIGNGSFLFGGMGRMYGLIGILVFSY